MISDRALALAVEQGLITAEQAENLRKLTQAEVEAPAQSASSPPPLPRNDAVDVDDESMRFITSFADIFVTIGIGLFYGAAGYLIGLSFSNPVRWAALALIAWLLAEFFTRRRRMALPSIVLLVLFVTSVFNATLALITPQAAGSLVAWWVPWRNHDLFSAHAPSMLAAALAAAAGAGIHYWRFRVPITIAAGAGTLSAAVLALAYWVMPELKASAFEGLLFLCGICVFALAMRFDMSDPMRRTRRADIAFWLHLLAAPLIVHPLLKTLVPGPELDAISSLAILAIFLGFGLVSVVIDRRALLVSGLTYAGLAFGTLLRQTGLADKSIPATLLALGGFILLLSAGWRPLRNAILRLLPAALTQRLPHPRSQLS